MHCISVIVSTPILPQKPSIEASNDVSFLVRPGGKILCVGTLDRKNELDMKIGIRKRLNIIFTYGGQYQDIVEVLDLIARKVIQPQVEMGKLQDFPKVLKDLGDGKIQDRVALVSDTFI